MLPEAVPLFYGPKSKCKKAPFYDMGTPVQSLHTSRDQRVHNQRRKVWDNGFSAKGEPPHLPFPDANHHMRAHAPKLIYLSTQLSKNSKRENWSTFTNWMISSLAR